MIPGIDVASFQHPNGAAINWQQVYGAGYRFVFIKLTEGTNYVNPNAQQDAHDAAAAGLLVGGYFFNHPGQSPSAEVAEYQANNPGLHVCAVDEEVTDSLNWTQVAAETQRALADAGPQSVLYCNATYLQNMAGAPWGHPLWYARPGLSTPDAPCQIWQSATGTVPGIQATTDIDQWMGDMPSLQQFFNPTPTPITIPTEDDEMEIFVARDPATGAAYLVVLASKPYRIGIGNGADLEALMQRFGSAVPVSTAWLAEISTVNP